VGTWSAKLGIFAGVGALTLAAVCIPARDAASADAGGRFVHGQRWRAVCHLPESGNPQGVLGFDSGGSVVHDDVAYFAFGDTYVDRNGDGQMTGYEFRTGTIATTTDLDPTDCITGMHYTSRSAGDAPDDVKAAVDPDPARNECWTWPGRPFATSDGLAFFYTSVVHDPDRACGSADRYEIGLARITDPGAPDLGIRRAGTMPYFASGADQYTQAVPMGDWTYLFTATGANRLARVPTARLDDPTALTYWTGSRWSDRPDDARALVARTGDITFDTYSQRYLMLYTCRDGNAVCARTARTAGATEAALRSGWNQETRLLDCLLCGHAGALAFRDPAHPERLYVTTAAFEGRNYYLTLWEVEVGPRRSPFTRAVSDPEYDWFWRPARNWWSARSYRADGASIGDADLRPLNLAYAAKFGASPQRLDARVPPLAAIAVPTARDAVTTEPGPGVFISGAYPSATRGAARVWTAPATGTATLSGEAWLERTCGDGANLDIWFVGTDRSVRVLAGTPLTAAWEPGRAVRFDIPAQDVVRGDRLVVGVSAGPAADPTCDLAFVRPTIVFESARGF